MSAAYFAHVGSPLTAPGSAPHADGYGGIAGLYTFRGRVAEARRAYGQAREVLVARGHYFLAGYYGVHELWWLALPYAADDIMERERLAAEAAQAFTRAIDVFSGLRPRYAYLPLLLLEGQWDEIRRVARSGPRALFMGMDSIALGMIARAQGDATAAWSAVGACLPRGAATEPGEVRFDSALALQRLAVALSLDANDLAAAAQWLDAHDRFLTFSGALLGQSDGEVLWAQYCRQKGDAAQAQQHAEQALAHATEPRQPLALLAAHRLLGELDTDAGRYDDARTHLDAALALADACAAPYERALTLLAIAELHAACDRPQETEPLVDEVRAIGTRLGAKPALARADALAARLSAAPSPIYPAGLSAREVEVLRLVAAGLTNPQVAERLFLSPRTIEQHLRSIFNKTGVSSRAAAARWATERSLV